MGSFLSITKYHPAGPVIGRPFGVNSGSHDFMSAMAISCPGDSVS